MNTKFFLIGEINNKQFKRSDNSDSVKKEKMYGIKYQQYEIPVEGKNTIINIPLRETEEFENFMDKLSNIDITRKSLKQVLRHFRGMEEV